MHGKNPSCDHALHFIFRAESLNCEHAETLSRFPNPNSCIPYPATIAKLWTSVCYCFTLQPPQEKHRGFSRFFLGPNSIFAYLEWLLSWYSIAKIVSVKKDLTLSISKTNKKRHCVNFFDTIDLECNCPGPNYFRSLKQLTKETVSVKGS